MTTYRKPNRGGSAYSYRRGRRQLLLTAPHCYPHWRLDHFKIAEPETGLIARNVARRVKCHSLVTRGLQAQDPNFDEKCRFKDKLSELAEDKRLGFVLDLHGAAPDRPFAFAIGTNDGTTELGRRQLILSLAEALRPVAGDRLILVNPTGKFGARHRHTIARFAAEQLAVPAAQLEINMGLADCWPAIVDCLAVFARANFSLQDGTLTLGKDRSIL